MTPDEFFLNLKINLNDQQIAAVKTVEGPVLLLAVPGSGKTTVLVARIGYMICCCNIPPENILVLTYTVAATRDMKERFISIFGEQMAERLQFRTINGICASVISRYARFIGRQAFSLVTDEKRILQIISGIYLKLSGDYATESELKDIRTRITYIKNMMLSEEEIRKLDKDYTLDVNISDLYREYCLQLKSLQLMDYDDQMVYAYRMLKGSRQLLDSYQNIFSYICVDEAQDTSKIQHEIIALLARGPVSDNLFMVGDEDQSIYGFRAAYPDALLEFEQRHEKAVVLFMEENFRSDKNIVEAADCFIKKNTLRHPKNMITHREGSIQIREIELKSRKEQYSYLIKLAKECPGQTAVLYRDNESVLPLVDLLEREGLSYRMRNADLSFFTNRVVLDLLNIIRFAYDPANTDLFMKIYYKLSTYVSKKYAMEACEISRRQQISVLGAIPSCKNIPYATIRSCSALSGQLKDMVKENARKALNRILDSMGYKEYLERAGLDDKKLFTLRAIAEKEDSPAAFVRRMEELQNIIREKKFAVDCGFILSTIHGSKGLEYDTVFLLDVADGLFPDRLVKNRKKASREEIAAYEEERRLFYVGITRAKNHLNFFSFGRYSTFTEEIMDSRKDRSVQAQASILPAKKQWKDYMAYKPYSEVKTEKLSPEFERFLENLGEGVLIRHEVFGQGCIVEFDEKKKTAVVSFEPPFGEKKLSLEIVYRRGLMKMD